MYHFHAAHSSFVHAPIMILFLDASHGSAAPAFTGFGGKFPIRRLELHGDRLRLVDKPMYRNISSSLSCPRSIIIAFRFKRLSSLSMCINSHLHATS
jgi:hypothetical protein